MLMLYICNMNKDELRVKVDASFAEMKDITKQIGEVLKTKNRGEKELYEAAELQRKWVEKANEHMEYYKQLYNI